MYKNYKLKKGASRTIINVVDGGKITNKGSTLLLYRDSAGEESFELVPGDFALVKAPSGSIVVTNRNPKRAGKVRVKVFKHGQLPLAA